MEEYDHQVNIVHDENNLKIVLSRQVKGAVLVQDIYCLTLTTNILTKTSLISKESVDGDCFVDIFKTASISRAGADYLLLFIESFATIKVASNQITISQICQPSLMDLNIQGSNVHIKTLKTNKLSIHAETCHILGKVAAAQLQVSGKLINSGVMHIKSMNLADSTFATGKYGHFSWKCTFKNEGVLATSEMIFPTGTFTNTGTWSHAGKFKSDSLQFTNHGLVEWENVQWEFIQNPSIAYHNHKSWIFSNVTASDKIHMDSPGLLCFRNSVLEFDSLNSYNTIFSSGQYWVKYLSNLGLLSFIDNEWTITDKMLPRTRHYLCVDNKLYGPANMIESEKTLHYDVPKLSESITGCQDIYLSDSRFKQQTKRTIADLANIKCSGNVYITVKSLDLDISDLEISNINNLVLSVAGNLKVNKSFKTLGLQLDVMGDLTIGSSNTSMGILSTTKGPLLIKCCKLDNRFGKIYGCGVSITTSGDVLIAAALNKGPFLYGPNGSYIASGDYLHITSSNEIKNQYGQLFSQKKLMLEAKTKIDNIAGEFMCGADIHVKTPSFTNTRDATYTQPVSDWTWAYSGCYNYCESSDQACVRALGDIHFAVDTGLNLASTILAQGKITYQDTKPKTFWAVFTERKSNANEALPTTFTSQGRTNYGYGCNDKVGYQQSCSPCSSYSATIKSGENIQITTGNFQIAGSLSSPIITLSANSGSFHNKDRYRTTINRTETLFIDMTQIIQSYAKRPGILKLTDKGEVAPDFSFDLNNKKPSTQVFDPLLRVPTTMFDLFIQSALSEVAGKIYLNDNQQTSSFTTSGSEGITSKSLSKRLWDNGTKFSQLIGDRCISREQIKQTSQAMLIKEIQEVNKVFQEATILCLPPIEVNPYQSSGDISANEFTCVTEEDQTHLNNRIVARDLLKTISKNGSITRGTEAYTMTIHANDSIISQDMAMPMQTMVSQGDVVIGTHKNISSVGTYTEGANISETAQTGIITSTPLILQRIVESKRETDDGLFSTTTVTDRQTSYTAVQSVTKSDRQTHKKASTIIQTATHDVAGEQLIYEGHNLEISSMIMANRAEHSEENDNGFTQKTISISKETASVLNASVTAPKIQIKTDLATIKGVTIHGDTVEDWTNEGLILEPVVQEMNYSQQIIVESPLASTDVGCKGAYEVMVPTKVSVEKIIRMIRGGQIKLDSVEWTNPKNKTQIIGKFVETTYTLKQWQITWNISEQVIPSEAMIIVSLAISYATMGMGAGLGVGATLTGFTGTAGLMASAGFTTLCNVAAVSLLQTGDPITVTKGIFSNNFLRTLAINVAVAGLCSNISNHLSIDMNPGLGHNGNAEFIDFLKANSLHAAVNIPLRTVIGKESMDQVVRTEVMNGLVDALAMKMASVIGQHYRTGKLDSTEQKLCHAVSGNISGGLMAVVDNKPIKSGMLGGAVGAMVGETIGELNPLDIHNIQGRLTFSKITAGAVAMMIGNSTDVDIAVRTGSITVENNLWPCILAGLTALGWTHVVHDTIETYNDSGLNDAADTLIINGIVMRLANGVAHYGGKVYRAFKGVKNPYASPRSGRSFTSQTSKPLQLEAPKMVKHHVFNVFRGNNPEKQKYRDFFQHHKIDIDSHTIQISEGFHKKIVHGTNDWTKRWMTWIDTNPKATTKDVYQFAGKLMDEYNVAHIPIQKYK